MSGSSAFFILIPAMYVLFTVALTIIAVIERRLISARWAAFGFFVATVSIIVDGFKDPNGNPWISWFTIATHFLPLLIMVQAFLSRHGRQVPVFAVAVAFFGTMFAMPDMPWTPPNWVRGIFVQGACTAIIMSGLPVLWTMRRKSIVDVIAFCVILGAALTYAGRTMAMVLNPIGETRQDVVAFYEGLNIVFHAASALMGMSVGIVLMMTIGYDILRGRMNEGEIDPLTAVGNRRRLDRWVGEHASGKRLIGAVLAVDLDHFKRVNDMYGHDAGDKVLQCVGRELDALFGKFGCVCRVGGEEFVILLREANADAVQALALSARARIHAIALDGSLSQLQVTASVGFCRMAPDGDVHEAMQRADSAVYCAKNDGRNRVVAATRENGLAMLKAVA